MKANPTRLSMYDFDGTLFRSTDKPEWFVNKYRWWGVNPQSLHEPCVPDSPGGEWWIGPVVSHAKQDYTDPATVSILITGRLKTFAHRVHQLLNSQGLKFDDYYFLPSTDFSVKVYKTDIISEVLTANPSIVEVDLWEDQNLAYYANAVKSWGSANGRALTVKTHNIRTQPHDNLCGPRDFPPEAVDQTKVPQRVAGVSLEEYRKLLSL